MSFLNGPSRDARRDVDEAIRLFAELRFTLNRLSHRLDNDESALAMLARAQLSRVIALTEHAFDRMHSLAELIRAALEPMSDEDP